MRKRYQEKNNINIVKPIKAIKAKTSPMKWFFIVFAVVVCCIISLLVFKIGRFINDAKVKELQVVGASKLADKYINQNLRLLVDSKILDIDLNHLKEYLENIGWVRKASVHRNLNGKIVITVLEENPYFLWLNDEDNYKLINSKNTIINSKLPFSLDNLIVIEKGAKALSNIEEIRFVIYKDLDLLREISKISFNGLSWTLYLKSGVYIKLPEENLTIAYNRVIDFRKKVGFNKVKQYIDAMPVNKLLYK